MTDFNVASPASFGGFTAESPFATTATESFLERAVGIGDPTQLLPSEPTPPPIVKSLPSNLVTLQNKYAELAPLIQSLPEQIRNALIDFDSQRVSRGSKPLTRDETLSVIQTAMEGKPATPEPERSLWNVPGNALADLGAIVKSIPRIPGALINEVRSIGELGEGSNPISRLANAPLIRMLPGAFIAGQAAEGNFDELARHPLFTALDALPFASQAAKGTRVGQVATEAAEAAGKTPRPLAAVLTQKLGEDGTLIDRAPRARIKQWRDESAIGIKLDNVFGQRSRETMRQFEMARMKVLAEMQGIEPSPDSLAEAVARAVKLNEKYGFDEARIGALDQKMKMGDLNAFDAEELAYKHDYDEIVHTFGRHNVQEGQLGYIRGEFYTLDEAKKLRMVERESLHKNRVAALREEWQGRGKRFTADDLRQFVDDALNRVDENKSPRSRYQVNEFHAIINVMDRYGYNVADVRKLLRFTGRPNSRFGLTDVADALRTEINNTDWATLTRRPVANEIVAYLKKVDGKDIQANRLQAAISSGNGPEITKALKNILSRKNHRPDVYTPEFVESVRALREQQNADLDLRKYTRRQADLSKQKFDTVQKNTPPARYGPLIGKYTNEGITYTDMDPARPGTWNTKTIRGAVDEFVFREEQALGRKFGPDEIADVAKRIEEENWQSFSFGDQKEVGRFYEGIENEVKKTWMYLKEQGAEPSFIHVATRPRVQATLRPAPGPLPVNLSQVQERATNLTPGIENPGVALSHQGVEMLMRRSSEDALDAVLQQYGVPEWQLRDMYRVQARAQAEIDPWWGFKGEMKDIVQKRWMPVDLNNLGFDWRSARLSKYNQETYFVPRAVYETLSQITNRPKSAFGNIVDPVTKVFRASVIALSPRTQLYNVLGGATMLMGETGPGAFKYMSQALKWSKNPELIPAEMAELRRVIGSQRQIMKDFDEGLTAVERQKKAMWNAQYAGGKTLGRLWRQIQESKIVGGVGKASDFMYDLNARMDDMYRTMAYLYNYDKAITKGLLPDVAEKAGMEMMKKVMMDWAGMTPVERTILKSVIPFYSFMNHAVRYVFRYPIDHPLRAGVLGAFGRSQQDDLDAMLPDRFLGAFFFGDTDSQGRRNALNLTPFNPFGDVANMLTFTGFLASVNPVIATTLEAAGLDRGEAELYPSLRYNPETGRLEGVRTNPLVAFASNVIPQSELLLTLMGTHTQLSEQIRRDPTGAWRTIASAGGAPILWREYNVPQEQFKAELARQDSQNNALNTALKNGDWGEVSRYPGLAGVQERVAGLPPEVLAQFTPPEAEAIRAQLEALLAGQAGQWTPPDGLNELLNTALQPNPTAQTYKIGGI